MIYLNIKNKTPSISIDAVGAPSLASRNEFYTHISNELIEFKKVRAANKKYSWIMLLTGLLIAILFNAISSTMPYMRELGLICLIGGFAWMAVTGLTDPDRESKLKNALEDLEFADKDDYIHILGWMKVIPEINKYVKEVAKLNRPLMQIEVDMLDTMYDDAIESSPDLVIKAYAEVLRPD